MCVVRSGQLLRPDEDTVATPVRLVEDQRRTITLEILNAQLEVIEVDLPSERDYSATMARPEFAAATAHIRDLLGAVTGHD